MMKIKKNDLFIGIYLLAAVLFFIISIPSWLLDILLAINILVAMVVLFNSLFAKEVLDMASFPTMLLFTTIFRISLNVSSTKLILKNGDAGKVVDTFGKFVGGGAQGEAEDGDARGGEDVARAAVSSGKGHIAAEDGERETADADEGRAEGADLAADTEKTDDRLGEEEGGDAEEQSEGEAHARGFPRAAAGALRLARAEVLTGEGGGGVVERAAGGGQDGVSAVRGGHAGDEVVAEAVDDALDGERSAGDDDLLHGRGDAEADAKARLVAVEAQLAQAEAEQRVAALHIDEAHDGGERLRDVRCPCRARDAPAEDRDEEQIQPDVRHGGDEQKIERGAAVAHAAEREGDDVVGKGEEQTHAVDLEIADRRVQKGVRYEEEAPEHGAGDGDADRGEGDAEPVHPQDFARGRMRGGLLLGNGADAQRGVRLCRARDHVLLQRNAGARIRARLSSGRDHQSG